MIRWITPALGTAAHRAAAAGGDRLLDVRELLDKGGNAAGAVRRLVDEGVRLLGEGGRLVVCCEHGMSRSNAVAAGVLAGHAGLDFDEAVRRVLAATGEDSIKLEVLATVRDALAGAGPAIAAARARRGARVLVTGATGLVGARLMALGASAGTELVALPRAAADLARDAVPLDLALRESGADTVLHLAHPRIFTTNRSMGEAVATMANVLDACAGTGARLVWLGSCEVYAGHGGEIAADESLPARPASRLGLAKQLCEELVAAARREQGLRATVLRPTTVYGGAAPRPAFLWGFAERALAGTPIRVHRCRDGWPAVDLLHVDDLCRAIAAALDHDEEGAFVLGGGAAVETREIARRIVGLAGSSSRIEALDVERGIANVTARCARAAERLGWAPALSLDEGLRQVVDRVAGRC